MSRPTPFASATFAGLLFAALALVGCQSPAQPQVPGGATTLPISGPARVATAKLEHVLDLAGQASFWSIGEDGLGNASEGSAHFLGFGPGNWGAFSRIRYTYTVPDGKYLIIKSLEAADSNCLACTKPNNGNETCQATIDGRAFEPSSNQGMSYLFGPGEVVEFGFADAWNNQTYASDAAMQQSNRASYAYLQSIVDSTQASIAFYQGCAAACHIRNLDFAITDCQHYLARIIPLRDAAKALVDRFGGSQADHLGSSENASVRLAFTGYMVDQGMVQGKIDLLGK